MPPRTKIETMPPATRQLISKTIHRAGYGQYAAVSAGLRKRGIDVSASSLRRYGAQLAQLVARSEAQALVQDSVAGGRDSPFLAGETGVTVFVIDLASRKTTVIDTQASFKKVISAVNSFRNLKEGV